MKILKGIFKFFVTIFAGVGAIVTFKFFKKVSDEVKEDIRREQEEILLEKEYLEDIAQEQEKEELEEVK